MRLEVWIAPMNDFDWRHRIIIAKLSEGGTYGEAATAAMMSRQAVWQRIVASPAFALAAAAARQEGKDERRYRAWLSHPQRGRRGAWCKPGVVPAFRYGRR